MNKKYLIAWALPFFVSGALSSTGCTNGPSTPLTDPNADALSQTNVLPTDGAKDQCAQIDPSSPTRPICINCYVNELNAHCPGTTSESQCTSLSANIFQSLVNECINSTLQAGLICSFQCNPGTVQNPADCSCTPIGAPAPSGT